jgi:hypothetical protein
LVIVIGLLLVAGYAQSKTRGQLAQPEPAAPAAPVVETLEDQISVSVTGCNDDGASGQVTNHSSETVDVYIETNYLDSAGVILDDGIDNVSGIRPGETANWDAGYFGGKDVDSCRGKVSSAFAQ